LTLLQTMDWVCGLAVFRLLNNVQASRRTPFLGDGIIHGFKMAVNWQKSNNGESQEAHFRSFEHQIIKGAMRFAAYESAKPPPIVGDVQFLA
jgi:hypothetical protein